ncbi:hypothetical protein ABZP36_019486 [Zizania latifolia]
MYQKRNKIGHKIHPSAVRGQPGPGISRIRSVLPEEAKRSRFEPAAKKNEEKEKRDCVSPSLPASTSPRRVGWSVSPPAGVTSAPQPR